MTVFERVTWDDVAVGDVVYIDNYEDGKFPHADPKISGPFTVARGNGCGRWLVNAKGHGFMHYPDNLLKRVDWLEYKCARCGDRVLVDGLVDPANVACTKCDKAFMAATDNLLKSKA